jgi:hypothetical protein
VNNTFGINHEIEIMERRRVVSEGSKCEKM